MAKDIGHVAVPWGVLSFALIGAVDYRRRWPVRDTAPLPITLAISGLVAAAIAWRFTDT